MDSKDTQNSYDIGVIGAGSATETLVEELRGTGCSVVVFEGNRVGGECPFVACIPSKSLLHDAATTGDWARAVARRDDAADHLDDTSHAVDLAEAGAVLIRATARVVDSQTIEADGARFRVGGIVLATGSEAIIPEVPGLDALGDGMWTTTEALTTRELPERLAILGGGVIGCELAFAFAGLGSTVTMVDEMPRAFPDVSSEIGELIDAGLLRSGVSVRRGTRLVRCSKSDGLVTLELEADDRPDADLVVVDRVLVAVGRRARFVRSRPRVVGHRFPRRPRHRRVRARPMPRLGVGDG